MVDKVVIDDMANYISNLQVALDKRDVPLHIQIHVYGIFIFHQFNGTRLDTKLSFDKIMKMLKE